MLKKTSRTPTAAPHCRSHCHQLRACLTLQLLWRQATLSEAVKLQGARSLASAAATSCRAALGASAKPAAVKACVSTEAGAAYAKLKPSSRLGAEVERETGREVAEKVLVQPKPRTM